MSRGEITIQANQVKPAALSAPGDWAAEYQQQFNGGQSWADQFAREEASTYITYLSICSASLFSLQNQKLELSLLLIIIY